MNKEILNKIVEYIYNSVFSLSKSIGENKAIIREEIKQLLQAEKEYKWICGGCSNKCRSLGNEEQPNCGKPNNGWQPIKKGS